MKYLAGQVFAMTGGAESHALIATNTAAALIHAFRDKPRCVQGPDMKPHITGQDKFCSPGAIQATNNRSVRILWFSGLLTRPALCLPHLNRGFPFFELLPV